MSLTAIWNWNSASEYGEMRAENVRLRIGIHIHCLKHRMVYHTERNKCIYPTHLSMFHKGGIMSKYQWKKITGNKGRPNGIGMGSLTAWEKNVYTHSAVFLINYCIVFFFLALHVGNDCKFML